MKIMKNLHALLSTGGVAVRMSWTFGDGGEAECGVNVFGCYMGR